MAMRPRPLVVCRSCSNLAGNDGFCSGCASAKELNPPEIVEMSRPKSFAETATRPAPACISITSGLNASDRVFDSVPIDKVFDFLKSKKDCYERTQPTEKEPTRTLNRVYVDIDGEMNFSMPEKDFDEVVAQVTHILKKYASDEECSLMESNKWKCQDAKGDVCNKLSYRLTYPNLCGTKKAIKHYVTSKIAPALKTVLSQIIPITTILKKKKNQDLLGHLVIDLSVYNDGQRKMRMLGQTKEVQKRPNVLLIGTPMDTLITYIPPNCKSIPEPQSIFQLPEIPKNSIVEKDEEPIDESVTISDISDPTEDETATKELIADVLENLGQHRWDYYPDWIRIGMIMYNEGFTLGEFIEFSKRSAKWQTDSPSYISQKWKQFRRSNLTQAILWRWLCEDDVDIYTELSMNRKDFWSLIRNANHAETARFFYNLKTDAYLYNERLGWYALLPNNIWKHYDQKPNGILPDIWSSFKKIVNEHYLRINTMESDEEKAKINKMRMSKLMSFSGSIGNKSFCDGVIAFLPSCYNDDDLDKKMDESRHLIAFNDMVYDLDKGEARDILPEDYICLNTGYPYPKKRFPQARDELVETIRSCFETEAEIETNDGIGVLTAYILKTIGSCLHGTKKWEKFYVWTGSGGNGKGLISELVKRAFGDYYHSIPHSCLTKVQDKKDAPNPPIAKAKGKRFVQASEPEAEDKLQAGVVKEYSGGDDITARDMYRSTVTYKPQFGLFLQTNAIPKLNRPDGGVQRRMEVAHFPFNFKEDPTEPHHKAINHELKDKIIKSPEWRDEMFHLLLEAFRLIQAEGLIAPKCVKEASQEYMDENNPIKGWLDANYVLGLDASDRRFQIESSVIKKQYEEDTHHTISPDKFKVGMTLCGVGFKKESHNFKTVRYNEMLECWTETECKAGRYWCGLRRNDVPPPMD